MNHYHRRRRGRLYDLSALRWAKRGNLLQALATITLRHDGTPSITGVPFSRHSGSSQSLTGAAPCADREPWMPAQSSHAIAIQPQSLALLQLVILRAMFIQLAYPHESLPKDR
jgi:hypothetical protein